MQVSYYPGCSLDGTAREYGESTEAICKTLGIELKELEDWSCCGSSSAHALNEVLAVSLPARNLEIADKAGLDLVVPCAACYQRLKTAEKVLKSGKTSSEAPGFKGNFKILHVIDFLWDNIGEKGIAAKVKTPLKNLKPVCYYGCLITRPPAVTDARNPENPQSLDKIMKTLGADVKKWSYKTDCCGGNLILTRPDIAYKLTKKLFNMAEEAGANCIVTGCPMCFSNLDSRQKDISKEGGKLYNVPIFYVTELMGVAFNDPSARKWLGRHMVDPRPLLAQKGPD